MFSCLTKVNPLNNDTVCHQILCCNEFKYKLNWYISINTIDAVKNISILKNAVINSLYCILRG